VSDQLTHLLATDRQILIAGAVLALIILLLFALKLRKIFKSGKPAEKLVGPVMFLGMLWSAEVVWELAAAIHFPIGLRVAVCAVLEFGLGIAMLRTKQHMAEKGEPGRSSDTAWGIAWGMALVGFMAGIFFDHNLAVAVLRPAIPLMLTKLWWDGVLADSVQKRKRGSLRWTPRNLLLWMGAIEADERDVETVNRDRLIQQMVDVHRRWSNAPAGKRKDRLEAKLIKLSEKADASVIAEVRHKRAQSNWFTVTPLTQRPVKQGLTQSDAPGDAPGDAGIARTPARRTKDATRASTSGDATDADAATQAARLVLTHGLSTREAAKQVGGTSPSTVGRRVEKLREEQGDAPRDAADDAPLTHPQINGHPVLAESVN
jgi:hypothetical protein